MRAASSGVRPSSSASGTSAQPSGTNTTYFIGADAYGGTPRPVASPAMRRAAPRSSSLTSSLLVARRRAAAATTPAATPSTAPTSGHDEPRRRPRPRRDRRRPRRRRPRRRRARPRGGAASRCTAVASGLDEPGRDRVRAPGDDTHVRRRAGRDASASVDERAGSRRRRCSTSAASEHGNEQGLLGLDVLARRHAALRRLHRPDGDTHVDEYTMRRRRRRPVARAGSVLFVDQPYPNHNGGEVDVRPRRHALHRPRRRRQRRATRTTTARTSATLLGKILRIDPTPSGGAPYTVPADNPFVGTAGARPEIWMYGLRNPWRFSFDRATGDLWIGDVGQNAYEEIDFAPARRSTGVNWGWNLREGTHAFAAATARRRARPDRRDVARRRQLRDRRRLRVPRARDPGAATACTSSATTAGRASSALVAARTAQSLAQRDLGVARRRSSRRSARTPHGELYVALARRHDLPHRSPRNRRVTRRRALASRAARRGG